MTTNRVVCLSYYRGMIQEAVTITRDTYRKSYSKPSYASLNRLVSVVNARVRQGTMGLTLWPEGFWANPLIERV